MKVKTLVFRLISLSWKLNPFKKQAAYLMRWLRIPIGILYKDLRFKGDFTIHYKNKIILLHHYGSSSNENDIFWKGLGHGWEKISIDCWVKLCAHSSFIIDAGANTGIYGLLAKKFNPLAEVFCFEPSIDTFKMLTRNTALNHQNINCFQLALSNENGSATLYDFNVPHQYSASLNPIFSKGHPYLITYSVETRKLSDIIEEQLLDRIDLMKIDVELHEAEVLAGMGQYLKKFKPIILVEVLTNEIGKQIELLLPAGEYEFFDMDEIHPPKKCTHILKSTAFNYLLCPKDRLHILKKIINQS